MRALRVAYWRVGVLIGKVRYPGVCKVAGRIGLGGRAGGWRSQSGRPGFDQQMIVKRERTHSNVFGRGVRVNPSPL